MVKITTMAVVVTLVVAIGRCFGTREIAVGAMSLLSSGSGFESPRVMSFPAHSVGAYWIGGLCTYMA